jgi:hypothetical protein
LTAVPTLVKLLVPLALVALVVFSAATSTVNHAGKPLRPPPDRTLQLHR